MTNISIVDNLKILNYTNFYNKNFFYLKVKFQIFF